MLPRETAGIACAYTATSRPRTSKVRMAFGPQCQARADLGDDRRRSSTVTAQPIRCSAAAAVKPSMPAPMTTAERVPFLLEITLAG
jgi:hypothetical protein